MSQEVAKHPVIQLRDIQLLLKREELLVNYRREAAANSSEALTFRHEQLLGVRKLLLLYNRYSVSPSMEPEIANSVIKYFFDERRNNYAIPNTMFDATQKRTAPYRDLLKFFHENVRAFAKICFVAARQSPELVNDLTFSVIPAIFGNFWCDKMADTFVEFLIRGIKHNEPLIREFGRVLFVLPEFRLFIEHLMAKISVTPCELTTNSSQLKNFVKEFVSLWTQFVEFAPRQIQTILHAVPHRQDFLMDAFIRPMLLSPLSYGFMRLTEEWAPGVPEKLEPLLEGVAIQLVQAILNAGSPAALMSSDDIEEIVPNIHMRMLFCGKDLKILSLLSKYVEEMDIGIDTVKFSRGIDTKNYVLYVYREPSREKRATTTILTSEDDLETELRVLLTQANVIPLAASAMDDPNIIEVMKSLVNLSRNDHQIHLQKKIDDLEKAMTRSQKEWSFEDLLYVLRMKFSEREMERLSNLRKITFWTSCVHSLAVPVQRYLGETMWPQSFGVQKYFFNKWLAEKPILNVTLSNYQQRFTEITTEWRQWCQAHGLDFFLDFMILSDAVSAVIGAEAYLAQYPFLKNYDKYVHRTTASSSQAMLREWSEKPKAWERAIIKDEHLVPLVRSLRKFLTSKSAAMKMLYWSEMPRGISRSLQIEGVGVPGADELTPCIFLILTATEPENFVSSVCYVLSCVGTPYMNVRAATSRDLTTSFTESLSWDYQRTSIAAFLLDAKERCEAETSRHNKFPPDTIDE